MEKEDCDSDCDFDEEDLPEHQDLMARLGRSFLIGHDKSEFGPSLSLTEVSTELFQQISSRPLDRLDMFTASDVTFNRQVSPSAVLTSMLYAKRLYRKKSEFLNQVSSTDVFLISMLVASKYLYDDGVEEEVYTDEWAESGNRTVQEINSLERQFISAMDWNFFVRKEEFDELLQRIEERIAMTTGCRRGFFTYNDLAILSSHALWPELLRSMCLELTTVWYALSVTYTAGLLCMMIPATVVSLGSNLLTTQTLANQWLAPQHPTWWTSVQHLGISTMVGDLNMDVEVDIGNVSDWSSGSWVSMDATVNDSQRQTEEKDTREERLVKPWMERELQGASGETERGKTAGLAGVFKPGEGKDSRVSLNLWFLVTLVKDSLGSVLQRVLDTSPADHGCDGCRRGRLLACRCPRQSGTRSCNKSNGKCIHCNRNHDVPKQGQDKANSPSRRVGKVLTGVDKGPTDATARTVDSRVQYRYDKPCTKDIRDVWFRYALQSGVVMVV